MGNKKIYIFALAATGQGISGSDRIFIEFARHWSKDYPVEIFVWEEGYEMLKRQHLINSKFDPSTSLGTRIRNSKLKLRLSSMYPWKNFGFFVNYFARIMEGVKLGLSIKLENSPVTIVYSASDFWMDCLPTFILKIRYQKIKWVAGWYQTAPKPWMGFSEGVRNSRYRLSALIYWLSQLPIRPIISRLADNVLVNNEQEQRIFPKLDEKKRVIVVLGAVDLRQINIWKSQFEKLPKIYDAVFQGRFHPQKGVVELIDIWKLVIKKRGDAKLVIIGDGPLMENVKIKIQKSKLENNVILTGYLFDGEEKYKIFSQSKLVVHPAFYDSGGMAAAEAMVFGLPCVGFNLSSYKYYYPKGMVKVRTGDLDSFADKILELLSNEKLYKKISKEATELINYKWSWEYRSRQILKQMLE